MPRHVESVIQRQSVKWFRLQYPNLSKLLFAVPNGGFRRGHESSIMSGEGVTAGVSDVILLKSNKEFSSLCVEFKTPEGKQTDLQKSWQDLVEKHGNKYVICRSLEEFMETINNYLHPKRS
jgi:hypothetical protein